MLGVKSQKIFEFLVNDLKDLFFMKNLDISRGCEKIIFIYYFFPFFFGDVSFP